MSDLFSVATANSYTFLISLHQDRLDVLFACKVVPGFVIDRGPACFP